MQQIRITNKLNQMKINHTKWRSYSTPYLGIINSEDYVQISFVVLNHHFWIIINKK